MNPNHISKFAVTPNCACMLGYQTFTLSQILEHWDRWPNLLGWAKGRAAILRAIEYALEGSGDETWPDTCPHGFNHPHYERE
jgi:hypothetical protein